MMFDNPNGIADATAEIMKTIREHLKEDERGHPCHYNRAFEAVYAVLEKRYATAKKMDVSIPESGHVVKDGLKIPKWLDDQIKGG